MKMTRIAAAAILALGASAAATSTASAGLSNATITSDPATSRRHLASFGGTASYDPATQKLTIHLNNTSASGRGFLTGFAFNAKGSAATKYLDGDNLATRGDEDAFDNLKMARKSGKTKVKPFGEYEAGAGLDGKVAGRGAKRGVAAGSGHTFVFDVTGADANAAVTDLLGGNGLGIVANFRGFKGGKSDQVAARLQLVSDPGPSATDPNANGNDGGGTTPIVKPPVNITPSNGNGGNTTTDPSDGGPVVGPITDTDNGTPNAVPLPPAAWTGLGTMGLLATAALRRRFGIRLGR